MLLARCNGIGINRSLKVTQLVVMEGFKGDFEILEGQQKMNSNLLYIL